MSSESEGFAAGDIARAEYQDDQALPEGAVDIQPDFWVLSDRVCRSAPPAGKTVTAEQSPSLCPWGSAEDIFVEGALALGVTGARLSHVVPVSLLRGGPLRERASLLKVPIYDVGNCPIVPGWVNAHTHLALAPLRGITTQATRYGNVVSDVFFRIESHMTESDVLAFTKVGAYESLLSGVTSVWDHFYFGDAIARALLEVGLCGVVAPTLQDLAGPFVSHKDAQWQATLDIASNQTFQDRGIYAAFGPHAGETVSEKLYREIGQEARQRGLPVHLHLAQAASEMRALDQRGSGKGPQRSSGTTPTAPIVDALNDCRVLMAHGLFLQEPMIERLTQMRWNLAYCPLSQLQFGFLSPVGSWLNYGGAVVLGTDCVASNDALDVQRELPLLGGDAGLRASFSSAREALLKSSTYAPEQVDGAEAARVQLNQGHTAVEPAELLAAGIGGSFGSAGDGSLPELRGGIALGRLANFLVLNPAHPALFPGDDLVRTLCYGATSGAILWGVVAGKVRGKAGGWHSEILDDPNCRASFDEASRRRRELMQRAGLSAQ